MKINWKITFYLIIFSYIIYCIFDVLDYHINVEEMNTDNCYTVDINGPEDFEIFENSLLISSRNYLNKTDLSSNLIYILKEPYDKVE